MLMENLSCIYNHKQYINNKIIRNTCCNSDNQNKNEDNCNSKDCPRRKETIMLKDVVKTGVEHKAPRILIHGKAKVGKSSWSAASPNPIFLCAEDGLTEIDAPHFPLITNIDQVWEYLTNLIEEDHEYKTLVVDSLDWLEKIFWAEVCRAKHVENITDIGYQAGFKIAMDYHNKFINGVEFLRDKKNMAVIYICHNQVASLPNPKGDDYIQYVLKLHKEATAKYMEACDAILFIDYKEYITTSENKLTKNKAVGSGERVIYTEERPAFLAGNRYNLPFEIPYPKNQGFTDLLKYINNSKKGE